VCRGNWDANSVCRLARRLSAALGAREARARLSGHGMRREVPQLPAKHQAKFTWSTDFLSLQPSPPDK